MTSEQKHGKRLTARSELESAMRDFINTCEDCAFGAQEIADDVGDVLCDASERAIIFETTTIQ